MARSIARPRQGRSPLQKAHARSLAQRKGRIQGPEVVCHSDFETAVPTTPRFHKSLAANVTRKRLSRQYIQLKKNYKNITDRENRAKAKITQLEILVDETKRELFHAHTDRDSTQGTLDVLKAQAITDKQDIWALQNRVQELENQVSHRSGVLMATSLQLHNEISKNSSLEARQTEAHCSHDMLRKKVKRATILQEQVPSSSGQSIDVVQLHLKDRNGVIRPEVRDMIRKLTCKGVSAEHATNIIKIVAEGLGIDITGSVSARSVARLMLEGLVQAYMQVGQEIKQANYVSICSDGTTIKNQQHEARSIFIQPIPIENAQAPLVRTLGVQKSAGHTAQQQFTGWLCALDVCCDVLNRSPLGEGPQAGTKLVAPKLRGMLTDHASDQKLLYKLVQQWKQNCDREVRAASKLASMSTEEQLNLLSNHLDNATDAISDWRILPAEQKAAYMHDAWFSLAAQTGEAEFQRLSSEERFEVDFLAWAGCCMHKEMNAVKGGVARMAAAWEQLHLTPPIALKNQFEKENTQNPAGSSKRGAIKLSSLAGALFNNKDEKRGYQKTVDDHFEHMFGYSNRFPDTSNTRYGSYCDAASELILHLEAYKALMEKLRSAKYSFSYTNIESNVLGGLKDTPTLTELAVLSLYVQSIGRPYIRQVRSIGSNAVELGSFHSRVKQHCLAITKNPDLLLSSDTSTALATLDGQPWDRPEILYAVWSMLHELPYIRQVLVAFFEGALEAWERFTSEFETGGLIAQATPKQLQSAFVPATNDLSEGALGQCRQMSHCAPTMTDEQRNARVMWQRNGTHTWAKQNLTNANEGFVRQEARSMDASGISRKRRAEINEVLEERAAAGRAKNARTIARRTANQQKLDDIVLLENATYESLLGMRVKDLDCQIDKLRVLGDKTVRPKSAINSKSNKINEILAGLERRRNMKLKQEDVSHEPKVDINRNNTEMDELSETESYPEDEELCFDDEVMV